MESRHRRFRRPAQTGLMSLVVMALMVWQTTEARADVAWWEFDVECSADRSQTYIHVGCARVFDCVNQTRELYGCFGDCTGPDPIAGPVVWTDEECSCTCMISGTAVGCNPDATCPVANDYVKCSLRATTTVDVPCDQLGYDYLCRRDSCDHATESSMQYIDRDCTTVGYIGDPPPDPSGCLAPKKHTGCSVGPYSPRGACSIVLMILIAVLGLSMLSAHRMQRGRDAEKSPRPRTSGWDHDRR